nr:hypothetical protein CFP56_76833 [Quercus suber]
MITGVLDLFMKPESPLVVIQASRMKENENSGLESDSEVDKLFRIRPTICNMYPLCIWFLTAVLDHSQTDQQPSQGLSRPQSIIQIEKLAEIRDWSEVFDDPILREHAFHSYERLRQLYSDLVVVREMKTTIGERCVDHFYQYGEEDEYDIEDLREVYFLLDWLSCQFCFQRPLKTKNLVLYGLPKTTKFKIHMLSSVLRIFFAGPRGRAFSGADDYFDLWLFDLTKGDHDADHPF